MTAQPAGGDTGKGPGTFSPGGGIDSKGNPGERLVDSLLSPLGRLRLAVQRDSAMLYAFMDSLYNTPEAIMRRNLTFTMADWMPTAGDGVQRDQDIKNSQGWNQLYGNIPRVQVLSLPLKAIGMALGLIDDTSPRVKYTLLRTEIVSVKVYNIAAEHVATLVDGPQIPGEYVLDWNMRASTGKKAPMGDYTAEVIVGKRLVLRKIIEVP